MLENSIGTLPSGICKLQRSLPHDLAGYQKKVLDIKYFCTFSFEGWVGGAPMKCEGCLYKFYIFQLKPVKAFYIKILHTKNPNSRKFVLKNYL